jgi:uncharacterized cupin superfamily protein
MGLKSPSDGRWDGRGRTVCDEPMHREEEGRPHQDVFGIDCGLWGSAPGRWTWTMMDRTPPVMLDDFQGTWQPR